MLKATTSEKAHKYAKSKYFYFEDEDCFVQDISGINLIAMLEDAWLAGYKERDGEKHE